MEIQWFNYSQMLLRKNIQTLSSTKTETNILAVDSASLSSSRTGAGLITDQNGQAVGNFS